MPPHAQRRLVDFVTRRMGQAIVTSHSPYVIEKFNPEHLLVLGRDTNGALTSTSVVLPDDFKLKRYRENRRQFAEAVLARAVLIVEGATEGALLPVIADVLEADPSVDYLHLDLAGVSVFNAGNDVSVPLYAPLFKQLGKPVFGVHDTPTTPLTPEVAAKAADFTEYEVIPYSGTEELLATEVPVLVQRKFLIEAASRSDYPSHCGTVAASTPDEEVRLLTKVVMRARKGSSDGYAALLIGACSSRAELPSTLADFLLKIDRQLRPLPLSPEPDPSVAGNADGD